ncbi:MAG: cob(I)yrinic acid a,c-diamide adenosyltransferase [Propionicimonas sp.]|uniref:cob(I)yrinic acid a,c-diamide adenosyltransferase n=1 Tax=Propionicimonas sp. TaxID=1955623 RepID=UPI002B214E5E|nr:cob(I)yrinic acid a,c-diamide adenosyltransferase [Propionicimonas sp.]MEA4943851.1 cob(I)yrinic acid a,c-diamide adenosyltransferase [Propionicimonas sp.]MEA5053482.1 cob(I)yrinic acid a,c-diamide adenosyltransferase [Propionicimonas sp.]
MTDASPAPDDGLTTRLRRLRPALIVNTGDGKGKSTAAFGTALRAWHQGWSIGVFQFVKSPDWRSGEREAFEVLDRLHTETGVGGPVSWQAVGAGRTATRKGSDREAQAQAANTAWAEVQRRLAGQQHDFYVLDEFTYPLVYGWLDLDEVLATLAGRPGTQHVVITGRRAPQPLLDLATTVTAMTKLKHPFDTNQLGQAGIEW